MTHHQRKSEALPKPSRFLCLLLSAGMILGGILPQNAFGQSLRVVGATLMAVPAVADCSGVADQIQSNAESFQADAQRNAMNFVGDEYRKTSWSAIKKGVKAHQKEWNDPSMTRVEEREKVTLEGYETLDGWKKAVKTWSFSLDEFQKCVNDPRCKLMDLAAQTNKQLREWLESFGTDGTKSTAERVNRAASLLQSYSYRLEGSAEGSISSAVGCMDQRPPRQVANDPVDLGKPQDTPPVPTAVQPSKANASKRGHAGAVVAAVLGVGLAAGAVAYAVGQAGDTSTTPSANFVYANWDCRNQSQCIAIVGHNLGSAGPFCSETACTKWHQTHILGTCTSQPVYTIYNAPPAGTCAN